MTTHYVEIRRGEPHHDEWRRLTLSPVSKVDADNLCRLIGPAWDARVVEATAEAHAENIRVDLFSLLEAPPNGARRWAKVPHHHHPDCTNRHGRTTKESNASGTVYDAWLVTVPKSPLTGDQWFHLRDLNDRISKVRIKISDLSLEATINLLPVRQHMRTCSECTAVARGLSVQAEIVWNGSHRMIREYSL